MIVNRFSEYRALRSIAINSKGAVVHQSKAEEVNLVAKLQLGDTVAINYKRDAQFATPSVDKLLPVDELIARGGEQDERRNRKEEVLKLTPNLIKRQQMRRQRMQQARRQREYEAITLFKRKRVIDQQEYRTQRQRRNTILSTHGRQERNSILRDMGPANNPSIHPSGFNSIKSEMGSINSPSFPPSRAPNLDNRSNFSITDQNNDPDSNSHHDLPVIGNNKNKVQASSSTNQLIIAQKSQPLIVPQMR